MQHFRKGQIVPRRLGLVLACIKGAQHQILFKVDCTWDGVTLKSGTISGDDSLIWITKSHLSRPRKNKTRQKSMYSFRMQGYYDCEYDETTHTQILSISKYPPESMQ